MRAVRETTLDQAWPTITMSERDWAVPPNLPDPDAERTPGFWQRAREELDGLPGGRGLNIAHEAVERHASGPLGGRVAFRFLRKDAVRQDFTYAELAQLTSRFANAITSLGIGKGDVVYALAGTSRARPFTSASRSRCVAAASWRRPSTTRTGRVSTSSWRASATSSSGRVPGGCAARSSAIRRSR
jgi:hypothetical protein